MVQNSETQACRRESIELRFRCHCCCGDAAARPRGNQGGEAPPLSPITYAYRHGHIGDKVHRVGGQAYEL